MAWSLHKIDHLMTINRLPKGGKCWCHYLSAPTANHFILGFCLYCQDLNMERIYCWNWGESGGIGGYIYIPVLWPVMHQNCGSRILVQSHHGACAITLTQFYLGEVCVKNIYLIQHQKFRYTGIYHCCQIRWHRKCANWNGPGDPTLLNYDIGETYSNNDYK